MPNHEFFQAVDAGNVEKVRQLIAQDENIVKATDKTKISFDAYNSFCISSHEQPLKSTEATPAAVYEIYFTPLHIAAARGHVKMVELLLENGADINAKAYNDLTPVHCAAIKRLKLLSEILSKKNNATTEDESLKLLCDAGSRSLEVVKILLNKGANVYIKNREGNCFLDYLLQRM